MHEVPRMACSGTRSTRTHPRLTEAVM